MRQRFPLLLTILALGCQGRLIDSNLPGNQPPVTTNAALAFRFGGPGSELVAGVASDPTGAVLVAGTFTGTADFDPGTGITAIASLGDADGFLAKYSSSGSLVWVSRLGGTGAETLNSLARDAGGNLYVAGSFSGACDFDPGPGMQVLNSVGLQDGYVAKYSSTGDLLWARRFGGTGADEINDVAVDAAGNVYSVGRFTGQANTLPNPGPTIVSEGGASDGFAVSFDAAGAVRWALPIGGTLDDEVRAAAVSSGGSLMVAGMFRGGADFSRNSTTPTRLTSQGGADVFLASYTTGGTLQWARDIGGTSEESVPPGGLALDLQNGAALLGRFSGDADFDPGPALVSRHSVSAADLFLARYDANGNFSSVATVGGTGAVSGTRALVDADGSALVTGSFAGSVDFDPGTGISALTSLGQAGASDAFVARYSAAGALGWVSRFGEVTSVADRLNSGTALALDPSDQPVVAGRFFGSPDFDPGASRLALVSVGQADGFVVKLTPGGAVAITP